MRRAAWIMLVGGFLVSACGSDSPTAPSVTQIAGVWTGGETSTSIQGGECIGQALSANIGQRSPMTLAIQQSGSNLTATRTYTVNGSACTLTGTISGSSVVLNVQSCQIGGFTGATCANGSVRDVTLVSGAFTTTVSGNTMTGTYNETWNVFQAGTTTGVGIMTAGSSVTATK